VAATRRGGDPITSCVTWRLVKDETRGKPGSGDTALVDEKGVGSGSPVVQPAVGLAKARSTWTYRGDGPGGSITDSAWKSGPKTGKKPRPDRDQTTWGPQILRDR